MPEPEKVCLEGLTCDAMTVKVTRDKDYEFRVESKCGGQLLPVSALVTDWPYVHADVELQCDKCGKKFVFGIPLDHLAGTGLEIYDTNPKKILEYVWERELVAFCPWHGKPMVMTKIFGDKVMKDKIRVQYKCLYCYLTYHEDLPCPTP